MDHDSTKKLFLEAYDAHADAIYRFCVLKVSSVEKAQDLTQEVFMRYWQSLRQGDRIKNDRAYLYTVARNLITDWYRKKKESSLDALTETGIEFIDSSDISITQQAEAREAVAFIQELDADTRDVLLLRFVEGLSPQEIAKTLHVTPNVVSVRIHRGLKKIQEKIHAHD